MPPVSTTGWHLQGGRAASEFVVKGPHCVSVSCRDAGCGHPSQAAVSSINAAVVTTCNWSSAHYQHSSFSVPTPPKSAHILVIRLRLRGVCNGPAGVCTGGVIATGTAGYSVQSSARDGATSSFGHGHVRHDGPRLQRTVAHDPPDLHADGPA